FHFRTAVRLVEGCRRLHEAPQGPSALEGRRLTTALPESSGTQGVCSLAAANKCLAQSNKTHTVALVRLHYATVPDARCGMWLITIAVLVLHLLVAAHAGSLKDADDVNVFRKDKGTFIFYCPRCKHAETKMQDRAA